MESTADKPGREARFSVRVGLRVPLDIPCPADLEIGDTAGLEICATRNANARSLASRWSAWDVEGESGLGQTPWLRGLLLILIGVVYRR